MFTNVCPMSMIQTDEAVREVQGHSIRILLVRGDDRRGLQHVTLNGEVV